MPQRPSQIPSRSPSVCVSSLLIFSSNQTHDLTRFALCFDKEIVSSSPLLKVLPANPTEVDIRVFSFTDEVPVYDHYLPIEAMVQSTFPIAWDATDLTVVTQPIIFLTVLVLMKASIASLLRFL